MRVSTLIGAAFLALAGAAGAQVQVAAAQVAAAPVAGATRHAAAAVIVLERGQCAEQESSPCALKSKPATAEEAATAAPAANGQQHQDDNPTPVPEPRTFVMMMLGMVVLGFASRRRTSTEKFSEKPGD